MELRQLACFVAVAEEANFTRAAARLHVAQSGLSATIKSLEAELRAPLFERTTRRVQLSPAGEALLPEARRTLAAARTAGEAVDAVLGLRRGSVALGIMQHSELVGLPDTLARFHGDHPEVELHLRQAASGRLLRMLSEGELDLAIASPPDHPDEGFVTVELLRSPLVLACRVDDPLARRPGVAAEALADRELVSFPVDWGVHELVRRLLRRAGLSDQGQLEVNDTTTLLDLVEAGIGIALIPEVLAALRPRLHTVPLLGTPVVWTISALSRTTGTNNPAAAEL